MKVTRSLDSDKIRNVSTFFTGTFQVRNRGLFMLGMSTGGRISELLSITIGDMYQNQKPVTGVGTASKTAVKRMVNKLLAVEITSDHEADAAATAIAGLLPPTIRLT